MQKEGIDQKIEGW